MIILVLIHDIGWKVFWKNTHVMPLYQNGTPGFELPRNKTLRYTLSYPLIICTYLTSRRMTFVFILLSGCNICRKNKAIKDTKWKPLKEDLNKMLNLKSKTTIPLTLETLLQLVGKLSEIIISRHRMVCKTYSKLNSNLKIVIYTYDKKDRLFIWSYSMWMILNNSFLLIICCGKEFLLLYRYIFLWE